jgi:hypothetical protein
MARTLRIKLISSALGLTASLLVSSAFAQGEGVKESPAAAGGDAGGGAEGYGYEFDDDPLSAGGFGPNDATIKVRPKAARTTLIRPRTHFIPEMLKSVENI